MSEAIVYPAYYQIIDHFVDNDKGAWAFEEGKIFDNFDPKRNTNNMV